MTYFSSRNKVSTTNSSTTPLAESATFTGTGEEVYIYNSAVINCNSDTACTLHIDLSSNNTNWDKTVTFTLAANVEECHRVSITGKYLRVRLINNGGNQSFLRLQTLYGDYSEISRSSNSLSTVDNESVLTRAVVTGTTRGSYFTNVPVTTEGHLEVAVHTPRLPFGSVHVESLYPVFQRDAVYGLNDQKVAYGKTLSGIVSTTNSMFKVSTGISTYGSAQLQSRERLRYRPGQGIVGRFAGFFDVGVTSCYLLAGLGHAEDGVFFGYKDTEFGILHSKRGVREIQTLGITTASSTNENVTVTLAGIAFTAAVTNSGIASRTAYEISQATYAGWSAQQNGTSVVFLSNSAGNKTGTFSLSGTTAWGTFVETKAGAAASDTWIPKTQWNGDRLDGSDNFNPSGFVLDPTKGNVYQIGIQYLGYGALTFDVEVASPGNNPEFVTAHVIDIPNKNTLPTFSNPSFPFTMTATSAGSTSDLSVNISSFAGFIEGRRVLQGNRYTYNNSSVAVGDAAFHCIFTLMNKFVFNGRANQSTINLVDVSVAYKHTQPGVFYLIKNATLVGTPNFVDWASTSCSAIDISATTATVASNDQFLGAVAMGESGQLELKLSDETTGSLILQPGETLTIAAKTRNGTAAFASAVLNTREDQ